MTPTSKADDRSLGGFAPVDFGGRARAAVDLRTVSACVVRYPAGGRIAEHRHGDCTLTFVLEGAFTERLGDRVEPCRGGDVIVRPGGIPHADFGGDTPSDCLSLTVGTLGPEPAPPDTAHRLRSQHLRRCAGVLALALSLPAASGCQLEALSRELMGLALERTTANAHMSALGIAAAAELEASDVHSLSALARTLDVHRSHLAREFRRAHGCTVGEFIRVLRIDRMVRALANAPADASLARIAIDTGYCDHAHMTRACRRQLSTTPSVLRAHLRP